MTAEPNTAISPTRAEDEQVEALDQAIRSLERMNRVDLDGVITYLKRDRDDLDIEARGVHVLDLEVGDRFSAYVNPNPITDPIYEVVEAAEKPADDNDVPEIAARPVMHVVRLAFEPRWFMRAPAGFQGYELDFKSHTFKVRGAPAAD